VIRIENHTFNLVNIGLQTAKTVWPTQWACKWNAWFCNHLLCTTARPLLSLESPNVPGSCYVLPCIVVNVYIKLCVVVMQDCQAHYQHMQHCLLLQQEHSRLVFRMSTTVCQWLRCLTQLHTWRRASQQLASHRTVPQCKVCLVRRCMQLIQLHIRCRPLLALRLL